MTFQNVDWVKNVAIKMIVIVKDAIAAWIGSGMFFILVPAIGDDHVCGWVATVWSNDWCSSIVPHVAAKVWNVGPIVLRSSNIDVPWLATVVVRTVRTNITCCGIIRSTIRVVSPTWIIRHRASRGCK